MKKLLKDIFLFLIFVIGFYLVVLPVWSWLMPPFLAKNVRNCVGCYGHLHTRVREIPKFKNVDLLILGSSHAYRGFDPRVFKKEGVTVFNLGSSSQTPIQTNILLHQYLKDLNPKLVILEVYAGTLGIDGVESSLDLAANNKIDWNYLKTLKDLRSLQTINSTIYGGFRDIFRLNKDFKEDSIQGNDHYISGGFVQTNFRKNPLYEERYSDWKMNPVQMEHLRKNIAFLKSNHVPYLLVQTPISDKLYNARSNNKKIDRVLSELGHYKNFSGYLPLNDTLNFYDSNHMNEDAVRQFDRLFIRYLKDRKFITVKGR